jgi:hypothetical protein
MRTPCDRAARAMRQLTYVLPTPVSVPVMNNPRVPAKEVEFNGAQR